MMLSYADHPASGITPWPALEALPGQAAIAPIWRRYLGPHYAAFSAAFLDCTDDQADSIPCSRDPSGCGCGCFHEVIHHGPADIVAVCRCEPWGCDDILLTAEDISVWRLSWSKLARTLCKALSLDPRSSTLNLHNTRQIGSWSADAVPVILTIQSERREFHHAVTTLAARLRRPFILLGPTNANLDAPCQEILANVKAAFFDLVTHLRLTDAGAVEPNQLPGKLFTEFSPQPKELDENTAERVMALVRQFTPEALTLFRLYCIEGLTAAQAARKCKCSRATIYRRLEEIRTRTGVHPDQLKRLSPHLARLEESISDPRASHINRKRLIYGEDPEQESR
jgi:predicted DNA-binding protein (UPF0251 family)